MTEMETEPAEECDHEWEFEDESFDHEFGTEVIHTWACIHCGEVRGQNPNPEDYDDWKD